MKAVTGRDSVAKLEDLNRYDARLTSATLEPLQDLWPPVDSFENASMKEIGIKVPELGARLLCG